jgi:hypothetical protein
MPYGIVNLDGKENGVRMYDADGNIITVKNGVAIPANQGYVPIAGQDGTNTRALHVDSNGAVRLQSSGVIGAAVPTRAVLVGAKEDGSGLLEPLAVDTSGRLKVVQAAAGGTQLVQRITKQIAAGGLNYIDYTVPSGKQWQVSLFYGGGDVPARHSLVKHDTAAFTVIPNGDFETAGEVTAWAAVTGSFTAPTPDSNGTQFKNGTKSMRWTYASSATALQRKQTFSPVQDFSGYRYLRVWFFNDAATAANRTISVVLTSGTPTRTYSLGPLALGSAPFTANTWIELICELENPTTVTGTGFDITAVDSISLKMQDSANKSGTVYWDYVRLVDSLDIKHRIYSGADNTAPGLNLSPAETFIQNETVYIVSKNTGTSKGEISTLASGYLLDYP